MHTESKPSEPFFEVYADMSGLLRWRLLDAAGRAISLSPGAFNSEASAKRSIAESALARQLDGQYSVRIQR